MTLSSFHRKWRRESIATNSSCAASLRIDQVIDCSFNGYEHQPLALRLRVLPAS